jgi:hypothetical protein
MHEFADPQVLVLRTDRMSMVSSDLASVFDKMADLRILGLHTSVPRSRGLVELLEAVVARPALSKLRIYIGSLNDWSDDGLSWNSRQHAVMGEVGETLCRLHKGVRCARCSSSVIDSELAE